MHLRQIVGIGVAAVAIAAGSREVPAQGSALGPFRWQLRPFCNVLTLTIQPAGAHYLVDGTDDLCGAPRPASVVGLAFPNADSTIGFGLTSVVPPGATPVHINAAIDLASLGGPWADSAGNVGTFTFTPGAGAPGGPRPVPAGGIAPGSITVSQLAPGAIAAAAAAFGACPVGQYLRGILASGSVLCEPIGTPPSTLTVEPSAGLHSSLALTRDGFPVVSHQIGGNALRLTTCHDAGCSRTTSTTVDAVAGSSVGLYTSIAIGTDGQPIISHHDATAGTLRVTRLGTSRAVDAVAGDVVGVGSALAIGSDGFAVISHRNATTGQLRVTHCTDVGCLTATTATVGSSATNPAIAIGADGLPLIAFGTNQSLHVAQCADAACTSVKNSTAVATAPTGFAVRSPLSIAIGPTGLPAVVYSQVSLASPKRLTGQLRLSRCGVADCSAGNTSVSIGDLSDFASLAFGTDGAPVIAHRVVTGDIVLVDVGVLRVTQCLDAGCAAVVRTDLDGTFAAFNHRGLYASLAIGRDGLPALSHHDADAGVLKITKCASRSCR